MAVTINASTSAGLVQTADTTGELQLQTAGTTAVTINTSQRAAFVAGTAAAPAITTAGDTNTGIFFPAADTTAFAEGGVEAMRIDSNGNVGIGTTSPNNKLIVNGAVGVAGEAAAAISNGCLIDQTAGFLTRILNYSSTTGSAIALYTGSVGTSSERMRIDSSGNVLVGTTTSGNGKFVVVQTSGSRISRLESVDAGTVEAVQFVKNSGGLGQIGSITTTTTATAYNTSSDYRLKENILPMIGALDKVLQLKPCTYTWKSDSSNGQGFIAHELQAIIPDAVTGEKDAVDEEGNIKPQGVDTSFLVATLTAAIQEQQTIINDLKVRIETLEAK